MSKISNDQLYLGYNKVSFFTNEAEMVDAGVFDMEYGIDRNKYTSGIIFHPETDLFDDSVYEGRMYLKVTFKHHDLSLVGIKAGPGHNHERFFISTDPNIPITDIYRQSSNGNIVIFGTPLKRKAVTINDDIGQVKLWEVEPFLDKEDIEKLINNMNAVSIFKKETVEAKITAHKASTEAFLQLSRAVSAESSNVMFGTVIKVLLSRMEQYQQKLIDMKIDTTNKLQAGIEQIEGELDLDVPWNDVKDYNSKETIENIQSDIRALTALKNLNPDPPEQVKEYAFNLAIEVCGATYMRQRLGSFDQNSQPKTLSTLSGLSKDYIERQMQSNTSSKDIETSLLDLINRVTNKYNANGNDMQRAVGEVHQEVLLRTPNNPGVNYEQPNRNTKQLPQQQYSQ